MSVHDLELSKTLRAGLKAFEKKRSLPGILESSYRDTFVKQLVESVHRVKFVQLICSRDISPRRGTPDDELFDPLKAAILMQRLGKIEEAFWLVFLFVHFGKSQKGGWRYAREVYGKLGEGGRWDWKSTSRNIRIFRNWLHLHQKELRRQGGGFGNHRKYQSLDARSKKGTGEAVETYVKWILEAGSHQELILNALASVNGDSRKAFDYLYRSMSAVSQFGRTARFDYLTMLGKLKLADIEPGSTYMQGATGPEKGAKLLFGGGTRKEFNKWLIELDDILHVGMQVLEDSLCNWQKSPDKFKPFRG